MSNGIQPHREGCCCLECKSKLPTRPAPDAPPDPRPTKPRTSERLDAAVYGAQAQAILREINRVLGHVVKYGEYWQGISLEQQAEMVTRQISCHVVALLNTPGVHLQQLELVTTATYDQPLDQIKVKFDARTPAAGAECNSEG